VKGAAGAAAAGTAGLPLKQPQKPHDETLVLTAASTNTQNSRLPQFGWVSLLLSAGWGRAPCFRTTTSISPPRLRSRIARGRRVSSGWQQPAKSSLLASVVIEQERHLAENATRRRYRREDGAERVYPEWLIEWLSVAAPSRSLAISGRPRG
jgi:hypothetical protein